MANLADANARLFAEQEDDPAQDRRWSVGRALIFMLALSASAWAVTLAAFIR